MQLMRDVILPKCHKLAPGWGGCVTWGHRPEAGLPQVPCVTSAGSKIWCKQEIWFHLLIQKTHWGPCLIELGVGHSDQQENGKITLFSAVNEEQIKVKPEINPNEGAWMGMNQIHRGKRNWMPSITLQGARAKSRNTKEAVDQQGGAGRWGGWALRPGGRPSMLVLLECLYPEVIAVHRWPVCWICITQSSLGRTGRFLPVWRSLLVWLMRRGVKDKGNSLFLVQSQRVFWHFEIIHSTWISQRKLLFLGHHLFESVCVGGDGGGDEFCWMGQISQNSLVSPDSRYLLVHEAPAEVAEPRDDWFTWRVHRWCYIY